jgi:hypothetical protein
MVRVWDYLEGKLLRTLDCQSPVTLATAHPALPDQLFVALANPTLKKDQVDGKQEKGIEAGQTLAGIYMISLRPKRSQASAKDSNQLATDPSTPLPPSRRIRLALPRVVRSLSLSPDGSNLISLNPHAINVCKASALQQGFTRTIPVNEEELTTLAFHPTETYFATGNTKGQIRLWYNVFEASSAAEDSQSVDKKKKKTLAPTTSLLHWHVHPISSLSFTPNGAYLLSGGQEAVIVLWQLHTNHQEYVPRLGAPIQTLTVVDGGREGGEQMVAARLGDGSVVFVGSQRLKIEKTIAGLKSGAYRLDESFCLKLISLCSLQIRLQIQPRPNRTVLFPLPSTLPTRTSSFLPVTLLPYNSILPPAIPKFSSLKFLLRTESLRLPTRSSNRQGSNELLSRPRNSRTEAIGWLLSTNGKVEISIRSVISSSGGTKAIVNRK